MWLLASLIILVALGLRGEPRAVLLMLGAGLISLQLVQTLAWLGWP